MALAGAREASRLRLGVLTMHAPFTREVECKMASVRSSAEILARAANPYHAACTGKGLCRRACAYLTPKLSRDPNQVARGRICRFGSVMPSQPVRSVWDVSTKYPTQAATRKAAELAGAGHRAACQQLGRAATKLFRCFFQEIRTRADNDLLIRIIPRRLLAALIAFRLVLLLLGHDRRSFATALGGLPEGAPQRSAR